MKIFNEGVTFPQGFKAQGVEAGIKKPGIKDLAVIFSPTPCQAAGVFTTNKVQAACVQINKELLKDGLAQAIVVNSGNANACTGEPGRNDAYAMSALAAKYLNIAPEDVLTASTGVIGVSLPMDRVNEGITAACTSLTEEGGQNAALAIMTTDTIPKNIGIEMQLGGKTVRIGAMAKGSGMIHPNMATMLAFVTTDADISQECLQKALQDSTAISYNMISVDGDTSTNDMVLVLANGQAGNPTIKDAGSPEYAQFKEALDKANTYLAKTIARDGEGATRLIEVEVAGAVNDMQARKVARSIIGSSLFKAAVF
ncbi:MAG: bifunctional glutamate N-acetyltransferase/amino-acid acetyltransferase ArgJ, partial [Ignavibacteriales bacterium]